MKSLIPKQVITDLDKFRKEHEDIISEWNDIRKSAEQSLLEKYCIKEYKNECDPAYCNFLITKECQYPTALTELGSYINN